MALRKRCHSKTRVLRSDLLEWFGVVVFKRVVFELHQHSCCRSQVSEFSVQFVYLFALLEQRVFAVCPKKSASVIPKAIRPSVTQVDICKHLLVLPATRACVCCRRRAVYLAVSSSTARVRRHLEDRCAKERLADSCCDETHWTVSQQVGIPLKVRGVVVVVIVVLCTKEVSKGKMEEQGMSDRES